jgi:hypothetical protein
MDKIPCAGEQARFHHVAAIQLRFDYFAPVVRRIHDLPLSPSVSLRDVSHKISPCENA